MGKRILADGTIVDADDPRAQAAAGGGGGQSGGVRSRGGFGSVRGNAGAAGASGGARGGAAPRGQPQARPAAAGGPSPFTGIERMVSVVVEAGGMSVLRVRMWHVFTIALDAWHLPHVRVTRRWRAWRACVVVYWMCADVTMLAVVRCAGLTACITTGR